MEEHQEYCNSRVYPLVEKLVTEALVAKPDLPVPFMVKWLAAETSKTIPTRQLLLQEEIKELRTQIAELESRLDTALPTTTGAAKPAVEEDIAPGVWSFMFGPEMDPQLWEGRGIQILDSTAAVARGWKLSFNSKGIPLVEPGFASAVRGSPEESLHGLALRVPPESEPRFDGFAPGCERVAVQLSAYDGRLLQGFLHTARHTLAGDGPPSVRHLRAVVAAAQRAQLAAPYIGRLLANPTYSPAAEILAARHELPNMKDLPEITCEELSGMADEDEVCHVSCLGYVVRVPHTKIHVGSHRGRDITARVLRRWRGQPVDEADDLGQPPFPGGGDMTGEELEFACQWLDHYFWAGGGHGSIVGFLWEFRLQREQEARGMVK